MPYFVVTRQRGPAWNASRPMDGQERWTEHAAFMNALVSDGLVVLGGPLGDGASILLIVKAQSEAEIHGRLEADPWTPMRLLPVTGIEPWQVLLGEVPIQ